MIKSISHALYALPLLAVMCEQLLFTRYCTRTKWFIHTSAIILYLLATALVLSNISAPVIISSSGWPAPFGISLVIDKLGLLMLTVFLFVTVCVLIHRYHAILKMQSSRIFYSTLWLLLLAALGTITTADIFNLYVWLELLLISSFILLSSATQQHLPSLVSYSLQNILGTLIILSSIAIIYGVTGQLNMMVIAEAFLHNDHYATLAGVLLFVLGLCVKGAVFPFYFWLPEAYTQTTHTSTMLVSCITTKVIMVVLLKIVWLWDIPSSSFIGGIILILGCFTMIFGVFGAMSQFCMKKILSFHIVSQLGYIIVALILSVKSAIIATLFFLIHNILTKTHLFMLTSSVEGLYQSTQLRKLGGITRAQPMLSILFLISALSLAGLPPFTGFWAKLFVIQSLIDNQYYWTCLAAIFVSILTLYSMIKIWRYGFSELQPEHASADNQTIQTNQQLALYMLGGAALLLGLYPSLLVTILQSIAHDMSSNVSAITMIGN